ncbi:MAG TPA: SGNH/GDSL hydrolase family protein [Candidatus Paceibacterota bacterium]
MLKVFKKLILLIGTIAVTLFLIEGFLILFGARTFTQPFIVFDGNPERLLAERGQNYDGSKKPVYLTDSVTFWKFKPSKDVVLNLDNQSVADDFYKLYEINSHGFRGSEFSVQKPAGTFRIIALGDSTTFGLFVDEAETYYKRLEKMLAKDFAPLKLRIEIISAGMPGFTSYQGYQLFKKELRRYDPDMILVYFGITNEFNRSAYTDREYAGMISESPLENLAKKSRLAALIHSGAVKAKLFQAKKLIPSQGDRLRVPPMEFLTDLIDIQRLAFQSQVAPVFIVPTYKSTQLKSYPIAFQYAGMLRFLSEFFPVVDIWRNFEERELAIDSLFVDEVHLNPQGHELMAEILYPVLKSEIKKFFRSDGLSTKPSFSNYRAVFENLSRRIYNSKVSR